MGTAVRGRANPNAIAVQRAVERSLQAGSARLRYAADQASPNGELEWLATGPGEADFGARRTRVAFEGRAFIAAVDREATSEQRAQFEDERAESYFAGGSWYMRAAAGEPWTLWRRGASNQPRWAEDPTWALDVVPRVMGFDDLGADVVAGKPARHFRGEALRPKWRASGWPHYGLLELRVTRRVVIDVWVDDDSGRIARLSWAGVEARRRAWRVTEFEDYGVAVPQLERLPSVKPKRAWHLRR